jgi:hypothetical protein
MLSCCWCDKDTSYTLFGTSLCKDHVRIAILLLLIVLLAFVSIGLIIDIAAWS